MISLNFGNRSFGELLAQGWIFNQSADALCHSPWIIIFNNQPRLIGGNQFLIKTRLTSDRRQSCRQGLKQGVILTRVQCWPYKDIGGAKKTMMDGISTHIIAKHCLGRQPCKSLTHHIQF